MATDNDTRVELARLDERIKALQRELERSEHAHDLALKIASDELARRLDTLNHAHQQAVEVQGTYLPRETYDAKHRELELRLDVLDGNFRETRGRLWLPMLAAGGIAAAAAAALVKLLPQ